MVGAMAVKRNSEESGNLVKPGGRPIDSGER